MEARRPNLLTGRLLPILSAILSLGLMCHGTKAECAITRQPAAFAVLIDTSGSMIGYYQRRDPRPSLAIELVQSLITETMARGDRMALISFDNEINDAPDKIVALSPLDPKLALSQFDKLQLQVSSGKGTVRTAALGRGVKALESLEQDASNSVGGVIYVVTDGDADSAPLGRGREYYDMAKGLQTSGLLKCISRIPQGSMVLEVWQWKAGPNSPGMASPAQTIEKVRKLLRGIIPEKPITSGPITADLERGQLTISAGSAQWKPTKRAGEYELPITISSGYRTLHFRGDLDPTAGGDVRITITPSKLVVSPGKPVSAVLRATGLRKPGVFSLHARRYDLALKPSMAGVATTEPNLFSVPDPVATARISGAIWLSPCEPNLVLQRGAIPALPVQSPPRGLQVILALVAVGAVTAGVKLLLPKPVPPLTVMYWVEGAPMHGVAALTGRAASWTAAGVNVRFDREGTEQAVVVRPVADAQLLTSGKDVRPELRFQEAGRFYVRGADGRLTGVNFDFGKIPPEPAPTAQDDGLGSAPTPTDTPAEAPVETSSTNTQSDWNDVI